LTQNSRKVAALSSQIRGGSFLDFSVLNQAWKTKGWSVDGFPSATPLPPTTPDAPSGDPSYLPRAYLGKIESLIFNESSQMLEISGWACRYGFPEQQTLKLFFLDTQKMTSSTSLVYLDFANTLVASEDAISEKCGTDYNLHRFKKEISAGQINKMGMNDTYLHAFLSNTFAKSTTLENGDGTFKVPKIPDNGLGEYDPSTPYQILGDVTAIEYNSGRQRLEVKGWACEVGDSLPADVSLAAGSMTFDLVKADLPSTASTLSICKTRSAHNFEGYISLNSIQDRGLEGQAIRVTVSGAFRNKSGGVEITKNKNLIVPMLGDDELEAEPEVGEVLGSIESVRFVQETKSFEIKGWVCEQGNSNSVVGDILIGKTNRNSRADKPSPSSVKIACQSNGNHNFVVRYGAILGARDQLVQAGEEIKLFTTLFGKRHYLALDPTPVVPAYEIEDTEPKQNILGEITSVELSRQERTVVVKGWLCDQGRNVNLLARVELYDSAGLRRISAGTKANLPSSSAVNGNCKSIGNHNFEGVLNVGESYVDDFLVPGNKVRLRAYPAVEGEPFVNFEDPSYIVPN
jgi:hypothetical protein